MLESPEWAHTLFYILYVPFAIGLLTSYVYGRYTTLNFEREIRMSELWRYFNEQK